MSVKIMSLVWDTKRYFTSSQKLVLLKLADCAADDGSHAYPSHSTIAEECSLSKRGVINVLEALYDSGILSKQARFNAAGDKTSNLYFINVQILKQIANNEQPVDKPCITSAPTGGGSERSSLGVVNTVHYGSEHSAHNPSIDPSYETSSINKGTTKGAFKKENSSLLAIQVAGSLGKIPMPTDKSLTQIAKEVMFFVQNRNPSKFKSPNHALNVAIKLIREGDWTTPRNMK
jgi:hypothetical protein